MRSLLKPLVRWEWVLLILLVPLLLLAAEAQIFLIIVLAIFTLLRLAVTGRLFPRTPFDVTLAALGLALLLSLTAVFDWPRSLPKIAGLLLGISLFHAAIYYMRSSSRGVWHVTAAVVIGGTGMALMGLGLRILAPALFGAAVNPNEIAGVLAWVLPLLVALVLGYSQLLWNGATWQVRLLPLLLQGLLLLAALMLLFTRSRGGLASVAVALLIMLMLRVRWLRWTIPLFLILGGAAIYVFGLSALVDSAGASEQTLSLGTRLEIWSRGLLALQDYPITGLGLNGFREAVHVLYPMFRVSVDFDLGHAHNHLLQAGLDLGIPGLVAYLALWLGSAGLLWRALADPAAETYQPLLIGLAGSLSAGWLFGVFDAIALGARPGFIWWLLLALLVFAYAPRRRATPRAAKAEAEAAAAAA